MSVSLCANCIWHKNFVLWNSGMSSGQKFHWHSCADVHDAIWLWPQRHQIYSRMQLEESILAVFPLVFHKNGKKKVLLLRKMGNLFVLSTLIVRCFLCIVCFCILIHLIYISVYLLSFVRVRLHVNVSYSHFVVHIIFVVQFNLDCIWGF